MRTIGKIGLHLSIQILGPVALFVIAAAWVDLGLPFSLVHLVLIILVLCLLGPGFIRWWKAEHNG